MDTIQDFVDSIQGKDLGQDQRAALKAAVKTQKIGMPLDQECKPSLLTSLLDNFPASFTEMQNQAVEDAFTTKLSAIKAQVTAGG